MFVVLPLGPSAVVAPTPQAVRTATAGPARPGTPNDPARRTDVQSRPRDANGHAPTPGLRTRRRPSGFRRVRNPTVPAFDKPGITLDSRRDAHYRWGMPPRRRALGGHGAGEGSAWQSTSPATFIVPPGAAAEVMAGRVGCPATGSNRKRPRDPTRFFAPSRARQPAPKPIPERSRERTAPSPAGDRTPPPGPLFRREPAPPVPGRGGGGGDRPLPAVRPPAAGPGRRGGPRATSPAGSTPTTSSSRSSAPSSRRSAARPTTCRRGGRSGACCWSWP